MPISHPFRLAGDRVALVEEGSDRLASEIAASVLSVIQAERGLAPQWPGRARFWRGGGARGRAGRDVVGVHYVSYYTTDGGGSGGDARTRHLPRRVALPLEGGAGQSLD